MSPRGTWKTAWPGRPAHVRRTRPPREASKHSIVAAYARVAEAVGLSADDVRETWLTVQKSKTPPNWSDAHFQAIVFLKQSEDELESVIRRSVASANRQHPLVRERQRFYYVHPLDSRGTEEGMPDGTLLDRLLYRLYYWENKREDAEPNGVQQTWLDDLTEIARLTGGVTIQCLGVVRPSNVDRMVKPLLHIPGYEA